MRVFGDRAQRETVFNTQQRLRAAVGQAGVGEVDGNEFGGGRVAIYAYGQDADALFAVMEPSYAPSHRGLRTSTSTTATTQREPASIYDRGGTVSSRPPDPFRQVMTRESLAAMIRNLCDDVGGRRPGQPCRGPRRDARRSGPTALVALRATPSQ